jgi:type I restriction enzyme S subunit
MNDIKWPFSTLEECLDRKTIGSTLKCQTKEYKSAGIYPIIDQGQEFISGWTDDPNGLISDFLPLIVFGDHTRIFKFIDFPFIRGADGTQLLKPRQGIDPLFFFYACKSLDIPNRGYNRHFSILKKKTISLPPQLEQIKIARVLSKIENCIDTQKSQLKIMVKLKSNVMHALFTKGLQDHGQKETEFGLIPENWHVKALSECADIQTGVAKGRKFANDELVQIPYLRVANVQDGHLDLKEIKTIEVRKFEIEKYRLRYGDVVLTEGGDFDKLGRGSIWRDELELCLHQNHIFAIRTHSNLVLPEFFAYLAQSPYGKAYFLRVAHKTTNLACINTTKLKDFPVIIPQIDEQKEIIEILISIDKKIDIHTKKQAVLEDLFKTLLHKLMTGEIRVNELDLSALERSVDIVGASA